MSTQNLVPVKEVDYLDQDPALRGQNYVCLSFVSPEDVIKKKEVFFFEEFIKGFTTDMGEWFNNLKAKYPDDADALKSIAERYSYVFDQTKMVDEYYFFTNAHNQRLEDEYFKQNDFQTSIRGLKVRGVFDTLREAEVRAQVLKRIDDKHNVFVAQVGCWCPWSPNPDDIGDQEYAETHLNTMMKKYKENQDKRDTFYMERKRDMMVSASTPKLEADQDTWLASKDEASTSTVADAPSSEEVTSPQVQEVTDETSAEEVTSPQVQVEEDVQTSQVDEQQEVKSEETSA